MSYSAWNFGLFWSTFGLIFLAELPDKTALASVFLAGTHSPLAVFIGAAAAFLIQSLVACLFGSIFSMLPHSLVHYLAAALFLIFAVRMWLGRGEAEGATGAAPGRHFWRSVVAAFMTIFVAEWGDLTQLATATLVAQYHNDIITIFIASTLALWLVTALGVVVGHYAKRIIKPKLFQRLGAVAMTGVAVYLLIQG